MGGVLAAEGPQSLLSLEALPRRETQGRGHPTPLALGLRRTYVLHMPRPAPTRPSIKIVKHMPYRGGTKTYSNRYFFTGDDFTLTQFQTLADLLVAEEKVLYSSAASDVTIVSAVQYNAGSDVPVATRSYSQAGTGSALGGTQAPGDAAMVVRFATDQRTSKNHPIYLFKYIKPARIAVSETAADTLPSAMTTALNTYGTHIVSGFSDGTSTRHVCGPFGAVALDHLTETYVSHRDFPR
jgi:hypothetical protein